MIFLYRYQSGETVHEESIRASSQAEAYSTLRKAGVRPMKVWPQPGFFNRLSALGKRGTAIVVLSLVLVAAVCIAISYRERAVGAVAIAEDESVAKPLPRQQCAKVDAGFAFETERFLSNFACPGDPFVVGSAAAGNGIVSSGVAVVLPDFEEAIKSPIRIVEGDSADVVLLKRIVAGLKQEARLLMASKGRNSVAVLEFFMARQRMEVDYRQKVLDGLSENADAEDWRDRLETANKSLRVTGLKEITENECNKKN